MTTDRKRRSAAQKKALLPALHSLGYTNTSSVAVGKYLNFDIEADNEAKAKEQIKEMAEKLLTNPIIEKYTYELIKRKIQVKENATRPEVRMIGHSGYITFGRKFKDIKNPYREIKPKKKEIINFEGMPLRSEE